MRGGDLAQPNGGHRDQIAEKTEPNDPPGLRISVYFRKDVRGYVAEGKYDYAGRQHPSENHDKFDGDDVGRDETGYEKARDKYKPG